MVMVVFVVVDIGSAAHCRFLNGMHYINPRFTYLLACLLTYLLTYLLSGGVRNDKTVIMMMMMMIVLLLLLMVVRYLSECVQSQPRVLPEAV